MNKILILAATVILISSVSAECSSNYVCGEWMDCTEGFRSRICVDEKCSKKDITERDLCGENEGCSPNLRCSPWSECIYTDKTENFLKGEINFGGYKTRTCADTSGCMESFIEENSCSESTKLKSERVSECGSEQLVVSDASSEKVFAKLNLDSWREKRLDIIFSGKISSCSSCFDGVKDKDETGVDCGGSCGECALEKDFPAGIVSLSSGILFLFFFGLTVREFWRRDEKE